MPYELKTRNALKQLDDERRRGRNAAVDRPHHVGCALGYWTTASKTLDWRAHAPRLAEWHADWRSGPSINPRSRHWLRPSRT
jgi:hypothetical protein